MKLSKENDLKHLLDVVECLEIVAKKLSRLNGEKSSLEDDFYRDSFIPPIMYIGKSMEQLSSETQTLLKVFQYTNLEALYREFTHMRWDVHTDLLWTVITDELPKMHAQICEILMKEYSVDLADKTNVFRDN
ncbi:hypothetical protein [uncultured Veillonella sp.]|uniref:hypothetical protein n=1 Tax=uncultured Veillonella sp. TaxID=159268 RepID=UPI0025DB5A78|nr:hypothetical protein [uncultured Veillonella sp.]MDY3973300.1 hypothetical protein [Veillonella caviae]